MVYAASRTLLGAVRWFVGWGVLCVLSFAAANLVWDLFLCRTFGRGIDACSHLNTPSEAYIIAAGLLSLVVLVRQ